MKLTVAEYNDIVKTISSEKLTQCQEVLEVQFPL